MVEVSKKNSPTGNRMVFKAYPKDNEFCTLRVKPGPPLESLAARIDSMGLDRDDLLFPSTQTKGPIPLSRNTFRTKYWLPALEACRHRLPGARARPPPRPRLMVACGRPPT